MHTPSKFSPAPKSAARLLAEQAFFAAPQRTAPADKERPRVTILSRRRPTPAAEDAANGPIQSAPGTAKPPEATKPARVFLMAAQRPEEAGSAGSGPRPARVAEVTTARPAQRAAPLRRRRSPPPPVTVIYSAPAAPAAPATQRAARTEPRGSNAVAQPQDLLEALAELQPILAAIRAAAAFRIDTNDSSREWERLSKSAAEIAVELRRRRHAEFNF